MGADADNSLEIFIKTIYDNTGVKLSEQDASKLRDTIGGLTRKTEDAAEGEKEFNLHGREMHEVLNKINRVAPGAGEALRGAFSASPMIGFSLATFGAIELVKKWQESIEEARQKAHEALIQVMQDADDAAKAISDLKDKQDEFWQSYEDHQKDAAEKSAFDSTIKGIQDQTEEQKKLLDAKAKARLITKEQADADKKALEARGTDKQLEEMNKRHDELEAQRSQIDAALRSQQAANTSPEAKAREIKIEQLKTFIGNLASKKLGGVNLGSLGTGSEAGEEFNLPEIMGGGKITVESDAQTEMFHNQAQALLLRLEGERKLNQDNEKRLQSELESVTNERNTVGGKAHDLDQKTAGSIGTENQIKDLEAGQRIAEIIKNHETGQKYLSDMLQALGFTTQATTKMMGDLLNGHLTHAEVTREIQVRVDQLQRRLESLGK